MRVPSPNQQAEVRRRKNVLAVMTVVWLLVVFGDDGRKPDRSGRKRVSVTSGDTHQVGVKRGPIASLGDEEPLELSATGATGVPSPTETSRNDGQLYKKHVLNAVGDNGAAQILADAVRESNGDSLFPKNLTVNLFGSWKQTKVRAALPSDSVTVVVQLQEHSVVKDTKLLLSKRNGNFAMHLRAKATKSPFIANVEGSVSIYNGDSVTTEDLRASVHGLYLRRTGRLSVFTNAVSPVFGVHLGSTLTARKKRNETVAGQKRTGGTSSRQKAIAQLKQKPRVPHGNNRCFLRMDFDVKKRGDPSLASIPRYGGSNVLEPIRMDGFARAPFNCEHLQLEMNATGMAFDLEATYNKASVYALLMCCIAMWQVNILTKQIEYMETQAAAYRISILSVGLQAVIDACICLAHICIGTIVEPVFATFAMAGFLKLVVFSIMELRMVLMIWKARTPEAFNDGFMSVRRELGKVYSRFYCSLLVGLALVYHFWDILGVLIFLSYSFWVPQIVASAIHDARKPCTKKYLFGMSASRLYLPLYMWACPQNFVGAILRTGPRPFMACSLVLWVGLQVGVLVAQEKYGPRFFVPQQFLPVKYNYRRAVPHIHQSLDDAERGESDELSCSICLNEVDVSANKYMVTPCNHFFHDTCLERWMDVKQECPVCRTALPSV
jgi:hypothetical protein